MIDKKWDSMHRRREFESEEVALQTQYGGSIRGGGRVVVSGEEDEHQQLDAQGGQVDLLFDPFPH